MLKLFLFIFIVSVSVCYPCTLECSDICYVRNEGSSSSNCNLIIDESALTSAGLTGTSTNLEIVLSEVVTRINIVLLVASSAISVTLVAAEHDTITVVTLNGPFLLADDFFRFFPKLELLSVTGTIFSDFPSFRANFKMVTLNCVDIQVSSGAQDITWTFVAGLSDLVSLKFIGEARVTAANSPSSFVGLDSLTKIEFDQVDFSGAATSVFEGLSGVTEVALTNGMILNLDFIASGIRGSILVLDLSSNSLNELQTDSFVGFSNVSELVLADNRFTRLNIQIFQQMPLLDILDLSDNQITTIETATFYATSAIRSIKLKNSVISTLDYSILAPLLKLQLFALDGNPLKCDCDTFWVARFHDEFGKLFESGTGANCVAPVENIGKKVYDLETYQDCNQNFTCYCVGSNSTIGCDTSYECMTVVPTVPPVTTVTTNTTNITNATNATMAPTNATTVVPVDVSLSEPELILIFSLLGVFGFVVLALIIALLLCICCCCCCYDTKYIV